MRRILIVLAVSACASEPPTAPAVVTAPAPLAGNNQSGTPGFVLAESLAVRVVDGNGEPVKGIAISWEMEPGNGVVGPGAPVTNSEGIVRASWRLPTSEGPHFVTARVSALPAASFSANSRSAAMRSIGGTTSALCGLVIDGTIRCWRPPTADPIARTGIIATTDRFVALSHAGSRWCAVTSGGRIACVSESELYQGEDFVPTAARTQVLTSFGPRLVKMAGGTAEDSRAVFCGLTGDGEAWCWGSNGSGQLGIGTQGGVEELPVRVATSERFASIDVNGESVCATTTVGIPFCWGSNRRSLLGSPLAMPVAMVPTPVSTSYRFFTLALTVSGTACGLTGIGEAVCWGSAARQGLGRADGTVDDPQPKPANTQNLFVSIGRTAAGFSTVSVDRELVIWGGVPNDGGDDGDGFAVPTRVRFDERFTAVLPGGPASYACMATLIGGARCIDLYVLGPAALRAPASSDRPIQFGVPLQ